jgi:ATP-dependent Lon protease
MDSKLYIGIDNLSASGIEDDAELIPLLTPEDEEEMNKEDVPEQLPILPLRNTGFISWGCSSSHCWSRYLIALIKAANQGSKTIGVVGQRDAAVENPSIEDLYPIGTVAKILRVLQMPDGNTTIIIQGKKRFHLSEMVQTEPFLVAKVRELGRDSPKR